MTKHEVVGWALIGAGTLDVGVAFLLIGPRLPQDRRRVVVGALAAGALVMMALGGCFLGRLI